MTENFSERIENALNDIQKIQTMFRHRYGEECFADKEIEEVLKIAKAKIEELESINFSSNQLRLVNLVTEYKEKLKKYEVIGTVEECREARERQIPKKCKYSDMRHYCPKCNCIIKAYYYEYCPECGQAIKRSE